jgi:hypothetical protein
MVSTNRSIKRCLTNIYTFSFSDGSFVLGCGLFYSILIEHSAKQKKIICCVLGCDLMPSS